MKNVDIISRVVARKGETISSSSKGAQKNDFSDYLLKSIWEKVFEIRTDNQGSEYIFGKLPVVTQYGITMYSGDGVDIPSLASGLPFDGRTIWYNPDTNQIEVIGGTGGGSGEGVSNFWDLSGIPSWITISKPKYTYSEIAGTPDLSAFATQNWIKSQGYASAEELKKYIPISGYTEVSGEKNFVGGLKVNGSPIYYDTEKKYWKLEGDLLVTGGVTMYGVDSTDIPSLINSLPVATTKEKGVAYFDPNFFSVSSDGKVSFIGETGGGLDIVSLQNYLTQNSYLNVTEGDNRYLKLSGGTLSSSTDAPLYINRKGNADYSNIVYQYNGVSIGVLGFGIDGELAVRNKYSDNINYYKVWHEGNFNPSNYLPLSGGKMTASAYISWSTLIEGAEDYSAYKLGIKLLGYNANTGNYKGGIHVGTRYGWQLVRDGETGRFYVRYNDVNTNAWGEWKTIAFTDSNVASATKLQTVRTIWGQSFDGTGNVFGALSMYQSKIFWQNDSNNYYIGCPNISGGAYLEYKAHSGHAFLGGNVGIGTTTPAYKLDVSGVMRSIALKTGSICIECDSLGETSNRGGEINRYGGALHLQFDTPYNITMCYGGGNVGIGTTSPSSKLDVEGSIRSNNVIINKEYSLFLSDRSEGIYVYGNGIAWHNSSNSWSASLISLAKDSITLHQNTTVQGSITTNDSVTINGIKLSKSKDGVLYLDGNLVVKGGVTMYGTDATSSPSIFDSLPIASTTTKGVAYFDSEFFSVGSDGKVSFVGKTDGFNATELQNYLTQNSYLNTASGDNRYLKLSGGELSGVLKISSSAVGLVVNRTVLGNPHITYGSLGTAVGDIGVSTDGNPVFYSYGTKKWNNIWHEGNFNPSNYLPLSGGKMTASAYISWSTLIEGAEDYSAYKLGIKLLGYNANTGNYKGGIHVGTRYGWQLVRDGFTGGFIVRYNDVNTNAWGEWKTIAFTNSNVASATKLQNARTIWGQSFDGTGDVSGILTLPLDNQLQWADSGGAMIYGISSKRIIIDGNVGIGTNTPTDKLHVHGTLRLAENVPHTLRYHATGTYDAGLVVGSAGNECLAFIANQAVTSFMFVQGGTALKSWSIDTWKTQTPALQIKNNSVYVNSLIADGVTPTYRFLVNGTARIDRLDFSHSSEINAFYAEGEINPANLHLNYRSLGNVTLAYGGGNVGIGTITPSHKLHVVGNTYLNGDVFADELNTFDVLPRTSATYDLGNSSYKWNNVYASSMIAGYIHGGGSALYLGNSDNSSYIYIREDMKASSESWSLTTSGTMSLSGDLTSGSYGSNCVAKFQGIGSGTGYCSVVELITNNEVTISYSNSSRYSDSRRWSVGRASSNSNYRFNFWNASYNGAVSYIDLNGNFWVAGGVTMYSDRRKKTILRDVELSLEEVANAPLIEHYYNNDDKKTIHVGSIAQYWAGLNDWFCKLDSEGYYTMEIQNAALASAISVARELDRYESKTDKDIKKLKKRICELEEEVERLKSA